MEGEPVTADPAAVTAAGWFLLGVGLLLLGPATRLAGWIAGANEPAPAPRWKGWGIAAALFAGLVASVAIGAFPTETALGLVAGTAIVELVVVSACLVFARRAGPSSHRTMGLVLAGTPRAALAGVAGYVLLIPLVVGFVAVWPVVATALGIEVERQLVLEKILAAPRHEFVVLLVFAAGVIPVLEEIVFRGFVQPWVVARFGPVFGVVFTSAAFASLHGLAASGPIFALSLFLGWLALRTGRLVAPCVAHGLHNGMTLLALLELPG